MASMRNMANMRFSATGIRLPTPQATSAVRPEARNIFAMSGTMRFMPRRRILRRKRENSTSMPPVPEMVVASARPRTPMSAWKMLFKMTLATTMPAETYMVVRVSCMAWKVRLSRSRKPKPSTPMT